MKSLLFCKWFLVKYMQKFYIISTEIDFQKVAFGALKKVFSKTLFPKILANKRNGFLKTQIGKFAQFDTFCTQNEQTFSRHVHLFDYDIGLFFFKENSRLCLKLFDGTGLEASDYTTNIFDGIFCLNNSEFQKEKSAIEKKYISLDASKLLVQKEKIKIY